MKRLPGSILLALALAAPARAQRTPAAAPEAQARQECEGADTLRARGEVLRDQMQRRYDAAVAAYEARREHQDSAASMNYQRAMDAYRDARRDYDRSVNRLMRLEMECMQITIDSIKITMSQQPKGWMGVAFSGDFTVSSVDGKKVMRFATYPVIESVEPASPAERAGVEVRDVLISINAADLVKGAPAFSELLVPGKQLQLKLKRGKTTVARTLVVEQRPMSWGAMAPMQPMPPMRPEAMEAPEPPEPPEGGVYRAPLPPRVHVTPGTSSGEGVSVSVWYDDLTIAGAHVQQFAALKEYFGVDSGVLVLSVIPGTPAAAAGLHDGDVITRAGGKTVTSPMQLSELIGRTRTRGSVALDIVRQRKKQTITLTW